MTLAVGEVAQGQGKIATTLINKQRVDIIGAKVKQASPELTALQLKATKEALTKDETIKFNKLIEKESNGLTREVKPIIAEEDIITSASMNREIKQSSPTLLKNNFSYQETRTPTQQTIMSSNYSNREVKFKPSSIAGSSPVSSQMIRVNSPVDSQINYSAENINYSLRGISSPPIRIASPPPYSSPPYNPRENIPYAPTTPIKESPSISGNSFSLGSKNKRSLGGFDVFVKTRGKWVQQNKAPIRNLNEAENFGRFITSTTPQASFQTKKSASRATPISFAKKINPSDFYRKGNIFIEKNKNRINTAGELKGITFKGLARQSFKKNKWRL